MHKDDMAEIIQKGLVATGDSIVNPRCDECNTPLPTPRPHEIGLPRLCSICTALVGMNIDRARREFRSQHRPRGRTVHVVKLPEGMRHPDPTIDHILKESDKDTDFTPI